jgi:hypothetical protein
MDLEISVSSPLHGERLWRRIAVKPYVNRAGKNVGLAEWQSNCVVCGKTFAVYTPGHCTSGEQSKSFETTTCPEHRMTPSEVSRLRFAKADDRCNVFASIKAQKLSTTQTNHTGA